MSKQVTIFLARRVTLNRADHDAVELQAGRNLVDADVAAHPFIKAHTVDAGPDNSGELDELRALLAEQSAHITAVNEQLNARAKENDALRTEHDDMNTKQRAGIAELTTANDALRARATDLEEQLAQKSADLDALVASMTPPAAETKHAKVKA